MPRIAKSKRVKQSNLAKAHEARRKRYHKEDSEHADDIAQNTASVHSQLENEELLDGGYESDIISDSKGSDDDSVTVIPELPVENDFHSWKDIKSDSARIPYTRGPEVCRVTKWRQHKKRTDLRVAATGSIDIRSMFSRLK